MTELALSSTPLASAWSASSVTAPLGLTVMALIWLIYSTSTGLAVSRSVAICPAVSLTVMLDACTPVVNTDAMSATGTPVTSSDASAIMENIEPPPSLTCAADAVA